MVDKNLLEAQRSVKQMSRALRLFPDNVLRRQMTLASREAANIVVPYVQKYVPEKTGTLKKNIKAAGTKTTPKIRAGTKTRGGPYAWLVHGGHRLPSGRIYKGVPYLKKGVKEAYPRMIREYLNGQRRAAELFNRSTTRKQLRLEKVRI